MSSQLYFNEAVKRVQGMKKLFLIEKLAEYFLQMVQFKLDLKGLVVFGSENNQWSIPKRENGLSKA